MCDLRPQRDDSEVKVPDQDDLAWDLLDALRANLDAPTINRVSMAMADRDYPAAIEILLGVAAAARVALAGDMRARLREWAAFYAALPLSVRLIEQLDEAD